MFARKCDRCGKLYENYYHMDGNAVYVFNRDDTGEALEKQVYVKDLCPDCMRDFQRFMESVGEPARSEPEYRETEPVTNITCDNYNMLREESCTDTMA